MKKRTKIVATIGPATESYEVLKKLSEKGVNVFRLNLSHGTQAWHKNVIKRIKKLNQKSSENFAILLDAKGPEIRTGDVKTPINLKKGDEIILIPESTKTKNAEKLSVSYDHLAKDVKIGEKILVDNGTMSFEVIGKKKGEVTVKVLNGGILESRRHLNLPGKEVSLNPITKKDWNDINFGIKMKVDFIALSFVRDGKEIMQLKKHLKSKKAKIGVVAKIESFEATKNLEKIVKASDVVMVARGDLGAEIPFSRVPQIQKEVIDLCSKNRKPVIVATHMLESMIKNPMPTRAEVTDIFQAVQQKTDCTMLSGETTTGKFPIKSVEAMSEIIIETEKKLFDQWIFKKREVTDLRELFSKMAAEITEDYDDLSAIVVITRSGFMANLVSSFRPRVPIYAFTNTPATQRKMQMLWGIKGFEIKFSKTPDATLEQARKKILKKYPKLKGKKFALVSDSIANEKFVPTLQIREF